MKKFDLIKTLPVPAWKAPREDDADLFGADAPDTILDNEGPRMPQEMPKQGCSSCGTPLVGNPHGGLCALCAH